MTAGRDAPLEVSGSEDGHGGWEVRVVGDVDLSSLPILNAALERVLAASPVSVGFELSGVRFMDSSGIGLLLEVAQAVPTVALVNPSPAVRRLVELSGLTGILPVTP